MTWEGRYAKEFETFWGLLFPQDTLVKEVVFRLNFAENFLKTSSLITWIKWLRYKFINYIFIYHEVSIAELCEVFELSPQEVAHHLREFLAERVPHLDEELNSFFQIPGPYSKSIHNKFNDFNEKYGPLNGLRGSLEDDVLASLEVMLYEEWKKLSDEFSRRPQISFSDIQQIKNRFHIQKGQNFFKEVIVLFSVGFILLVALKYGNKWYEEYLVDKIGLLGPNLFWLDRSLSFRKQDPLQNQDVELSYDQIEELEKLEAENQGVQLSDTEDRVGEESDVVLASVDSLPRDFSSAGLEQSAYEESKKGGYRNSRFGRQRAFRVLMNSFDAGPIRKKIVELMSLYNVKQADKVTPGQKIPGGLYFNLFVPREYLKDFLLKVSSMDESTVLESNTRYPGPAGTNKVFIWVKSL